MPSRKLTFTLPPDLAVEFLHRVPPNNRSQYVAAAIAAKLREREEQLAHVCELANSSADIRDIATSFESFADDSDRVQESW